MERKLAAILSADVAGYSRLMAENEEATLRTLAAYCDTIAGLVDEHDGRIFGSAGDSVIAEFASTVQAVRAAVAIQRALDRRNVDLPQGQRMEFRIGINLGDIMVEGDNLFGDGVNIAARLQEVAAPGGICISGAVREQIDGKLDFPITHLGERSLKNIPRPVQVHRVDSRLDDPSTTGVLGGALSLPDRPSIAVLPFVNMSNDPEQEYFADGITEDIITALSKYRWFFVIARNSSFAYKDRAVDVKQVAHELGVRYVLEGSVRKAGDRVRVTAQLIEADSGNHQWAERYDREYADIFSIQDEITESVVGAIEPELQMGEGRRAAQKIAINLDAYECCMRALWYHHQFTPEENLEAETWERRSIGLDAKFARAHVYLARTLSGRCWWGWSKDVKQDLAAAYAAAQHAVELDDRDPYSHFIFANTSMQTGRHRQALVEAQRAIDLSPNFALAHMALGLSRIFIGHFAEALDPLLRCLRLSPQDPMAFEFKSLIALSHYQLGNYKEAVYFAESALRSRRIYTVMRTLAASLGQLGRIEEAGVALAEMERIKPTDAEGHWDITNAYANPDHAKHVVEGLRKAGAAI
ncbi:MAG: adenylate/guanylate cyclase domain-containing protein [Gammaproteobacteria bacterium]